MQKLIVTAEGCSRLEDTLFEIVHATLIYLFFFSFIVDVGLLTKPFNSTNATTHIIK
jgi:hypothetical protein